VSCHNLDICVYLETEITMMDFTAELDFKSRLGIGKTCLIAGVDEAGRGALAGPVVAAAVVFLDYSKANDLLSEINDSKKLTPAKRERLYEDMRADDNVMTGVGIIDNDMIDKVNILNATFKAMVAAVADLPKSPCGVIIDGNKTPPALSVPAVAVVKGDAKIMSVAAASIIAKVTRDRIMTDLARRYPVYEWDVNKGYGTKKHYDVLEKHGPCPYHRRSFRLNRQSSLLKDQCRPLFPNLSL